MAKKYIPEYETLKAKSQLESWSRYVDAKSILRKLKSEGVDVSVHFKFLIGKHYTLSIEEFNEIKLYYSL